MVGCGDHGKGLSDSLNKLKLQPLMKRPKTTTYSTMPSPYCSFILKTDHPAIPSDGQRKREINTEPVVSSRWNPTREQIYALEEMYRGGTRTPTAEQIQQIVAKLRRFGKIEGKNVFYWFQNHKARERQKRRRQLESSCGELGDIRNLGEKRSVLSRTGFEADKKKKWATPSNCSTISEESVSIHREVVAEKGIQVEGKDNVTGCEDESRECQTLQLFPLWSDIGGDGNIVNVGKNDGEVAVRNITTKFTPIKFFEFLPLKS